MSSSESYIDNIQKAEGYIKEAKDAGSEFILFPELFTTGLHWDVFDRYKAVCNEVEEQLSALAKKYSIHLGGSVLHKNKEGSFTNAFLLYDKSGECISCYEKIHLISLLDEDKALSPGKKLSTYDFEFGKVGFAICYDVRFCEMFAKYATSGCSCIFICSAFPKIRIEHLKSLLIARAIENQMYVVSVNRVGIDKIPDIGDSEYGGSSMIIDPLGNVETLASDSKEELVSHTIDLEKVTKTRSTFHTLKDRVPDKYHL
ncbi:MAG: Omega-amidase YafV [Chlamydiia bacterium]|nr:Omega-amidase YafV [Chlamydiia bacterium]